jgi:hypothetical protein
MGIAVRVRWQVLQNCEKIESAFTLKKDRAPSHRPRKKLYLRNLCQPPPGITRQWGRSLQRECPNY